MFVPCQAICRKYESINELACRSGGRALYASRYEIFGVGPNKEQSGMGVDAAAIVVPDMSVCSKEKASER